MVQRLRAEGDQVPVILLTARSEEVDRVLEVCSDAPEGFFCVHLDLPLIGMTTRAVSSAAATSPSVCRSA